jgi:antibiotic biosynthesis monooxygenase (ABM) superfamily enzyme
MTKAGMKQVDAPSEIDPVTIAVTFKVKPRREGDFERWAHDITVAASKFPGHLGASWMRAGATYHVVYRFAGHALFHDWHESAVRARFLERLEPIATLVTDDHLTGLETWFELPKQPALPAPPRWKMVIATWIGVFPLLTLLQWMLGSRLMTLPLIARVMLLTLIVVALMTYVVMPRLVRILRRWLYPTLNPSPARNPSTPQLTHHADTPKALTTR